jgi:hypothetical protein
MDRVVKLGGLIGIGLVALVGVLVLLGGTPSRPQRQLSGQPTRGAAGDSRFAQVGETVKLQGWEVTLVDFGPYERFSPGPSASSLGGTLLVADVRIKNIQNRTGDFAPNEFALRTGNGRRFGPAAETANVERGLAAAETVPPGQTSEKRVVFDVPPDARDLRFEALEIEFAVRAVSQ